MGNTKYIGRVGGLAVALGVGIAVATTPGIALADDTASTNSAGTPKRRAPPAKHPNPRAPRPPPEPPRNHRHVRHRGFADGRRLRPGLDAVDTSTSGTSASTDASVRQAPPGMVNATGGAQIVKKVEQRHVNGR